MQSLFWLKTPFWERQKTRLAKTIGNRLALKIYTYLLNYTTKEVQKIDCKKTVLLAYHTNEEELFPEKNFYRALQINGNLGDKIKHAFQVGFQHKQEKVVVIGSDCFELKATHYAKTFELLNNNDVVIGPALDGGYYLIALKKPFPALFENKSWSTEQLLKETVATIKEHKLTYCLLETLRDIDTENDLKNHSELTQLLKPNKQGES